MTPGHVATARALKGSRWAHRGRGPYRFDCAGLVVVALRANGYAVTDQDGYGREPALNTDSRLQAAMRAHFGEPVAVGLRGLTLLQVGDIALFRSGRAGDPMHVGIFGDYFLGGLSLIHASNEPGAMRVIEHRFGNPFDTRFVEAYRPGVR